MSTLFFGTVSLLSWPLAKQAPASPARPAALAPPAAPAAAVTDAVGAGAAVVPPAPTALVPRAIGSTSYGRMLKIPTAVVTTRRAANEDKAPSYYAAGSTAETCFRASPTRICGSRAKVRWALDGHDRAVVLHTVRTGHHAAEADSTVERMAMAALGEGSTPLGEFFDHKGRRTLILPRWDCDLFTFEAHPAKAEARRLVGRKVLRDLAGCYTKLHAQGLVHNDGKPENVLLRVNGQVTLTDFDSSFVDLEADTGANRRIVGSPSYPAPEWGHNAPFDRSIDVFLLGLTLLSFFDGMVYENFVGPSDTPSFARSRRLVAVIERYNDVRAGLAAPPSFDQNKDVFARYVWLARLREEAAGVDTELTNFLFERMLVYERSERATMPAVLDFANRLMPPASRDERRAVRVIGRHTAKLPEYVAQEADYARLRAFPPLPPPLQPAKGWLLSLVKTLLRLR